MITLPLPNYEGLFEYSNNQLLIPMGKEMIELDLETEDPIQRKIISGIMFYCWTQISKDYATSSPESDFCRLAIDFWDNWSDFNISRMHEAKSILIKMKRFSHLRGKLILIEENK